MEAQVSTTQAVPRRPFASLSLREQCCIKCDDMDFQDWLFAKHQWLGGGDPKEAAAALVRTALKIESRKELDTDKRAGQGWRDMLAKFMADKAAPSGAHYAEMRG